MYSLVLKINRCLCFWGKNGYLKYFNPQPSLILFTGEKRRKSEGDTVQKFNAEKEMFLKELKSIKKALENSYFNLGYFWIK